jgi:hypothetical protein
MAKKTDNYNLYAKLELRRLLLRRFHATGPIDVLDCCQGNGVIWGQLRQEFPVTGYLGLDQKRQKGRLAVDSARALDQPGWPQNVIDIDTYGAPWKHYQAVLKHLHGSTTVFLTIGQWQMGTDRLILQSLGLTGLHVPPGIQVKLHDLALGYCLTMGGVYGSILTAAFESVSDGHARYIGVRLERSQDKERGYVVGKIP